MCNVANCTYKDWGGGYCKNHQYLREDIAEFKRKRAILRISKREKTKKQLNERQEKKKEDTEKMFNLFIKLWKERGPYSEISGTYLGSEPLSIFFHHCAPKRKYPELLLDEDNIIILTWEEHQKAEQDPNFFPTVIQRRELVLAKIKKEP